VNIAIALRDAAAEWAEQGCIATADLMREAARHIDDLQHELDVTNELLSGVVIRPGPNFPEHSA
jgi:hypothetical protein